MKIIKQHLLYDEDEFNEEKILRKLELCGRTAYRSEDLVSKDSCYKFIKKIMNNKHESVLEHCALTFRIVTNRLITHELVRHRIASFTQESTRYVNYSKGKFNNEITVILPRRFYNLDSSITQYKYNLWCRSIELAELSYFELLKNGDTPQEAREVLPQALASEIVITANIREWRHIIKLRSAKEADPMMQELINDVLDILVKQLPSLFEDLK